MSDNHKAPNESQPELIPVEQFAPAEVSEIDLYQKREKIYTRKIEGFFQKVRQYTGWPLLTGYFLLPWINWNGRQSVLFDLPERQFHILGLTFWPQDLTMLAWILIIAAFTLFAVTNLAGRVWCGYTCPQTVWTSIFMWIEQKVEGSRNQRIKLDAQPWSFEKIRKKLLKHALWISVAFYTGFTFVGYFTPIHELGFDIFRLAVNPWAAFWIIFFTAATYANAGWMREQVCLYMCPYARFQSAMFDANTLIISYDQERGEPRGSRKRNEDPSSSGKGDCIDCQLCVQVCPTGIDIRNGLQYECIGCALCVDACNSVMEKMNYPKGLIRYTTENTLKHAPSNILRPRLLGYIVAIIGMSLLLSYNILTRDALELSALRERQALFYETTPGIIENHYTLKVANKTQSKHHYIITLDAPSALQYVGPETIVVASGEVNEFPIRVTARKNALTESNTAIRFSVKRADLLDESASTESRFFGPAQK